MTSAIRLRAVVPADLDAFYEHQNDPVGVRMVGILPRKRDDFYAHWTEAGRDPTVTLRSILVDGRLAGSVASFVRNDLREVCYWIDRELWGQGIATEGLRLLLQEVHERPLYARVAKDHLASQRVLTKCGFVLCGEGKCFADARGEEIEEWILELVSSTKALDAAPVPPPAA
jgi:RimJ/RimL family protein N-acetyltransferase